jgi:tetratricopeptide (TPR) repeat protein
VKKTNVILTIFILEFVAFAPAESSPQLSPAEQKIAWARKQIEKQPNRYQAYSDLAMALARRARETSDTRFYMQAQEALGKSLALMPDNFEARKAEVWILLGQHEFALAREKAIELNKHVPDEVMVYGFLTDANAELGNYDEAEKAAQWMLDIRPGNVPGLTRAAYLRELFGDVDGALEFMGQAYEQTPPNELEDRAWVLTQMAHLQLSVGKLDSAQSLLQQALQLFPGYHYALANLAKVKLEQKSYEEAAQLFRRRYLAAPHAENLYDLAQALERAGHADEARQAYAEFEQKSLHESTIADNSNRELIFFYADHAHEPTEALRIARLEAARRHDVYTLDAFAWALYANGHYAEARRQMEKALGVGIRDSKLFYHAGAIASKLKDADAARKYLTRSLELDSHSESADAARSILSALVTDSNLAARRAE